MGKRRGVKPSKGREKGPGKSTGGAPFPQYSTSPAEAATGGGLLAYAPWKELLAILIIVAIGLGVRLEDLRDWTAHPEIAMYHGQPLLTTFDGYFYLSLAKDIKEGSYTPVDYKRNIPQGWPRRFPPPLLSWIGARVSQLTGASLDWVGAVLPAFLGMLLMVPIYLLGRFYGGPICAATGSLVGLLSFYYVYRSSLGWFDTDCMNVTWATSITAALLWFGVERRRRRYIWFTAALLLYGLFLLWWDSTPAVATAVSAVPLAIALLFFYRPPRREGLLFLGALAVMAAGVLVWQGWDLPIRIVKHVWSQYQYISTKHPVGLWPAIGETISEQEIPTFREVVFKTAGSMPAFFCACVGLAWLFYWRPKDSLFLSVALILGGLSFLFAKRFMIFLAPVLAVGAGFFAARLWSLRGRWPILTWITPLVVVGICIIPLRQGFTKTFWPKEPPHLIDGFVYAHQHLPKDAILWAWWDHGYPIQYFARLGTVGDGSLHSGQRATYNGLPMATSSQRLAANFMQFYAGRGMEGPELFYKALGRDVARGQRLMVEILANGPEAGRKVLQGLHLRPQGPYRDVDSWLRFFYPAKTRPVYLFLDWRLTVTAYWWFWLGSWDVARHRGHHPVYAAFYGLRLQGDRVVGPGVEVDLKKGVLRTQGKALRLKAVLLVDQKGPRLNKYPGEGGLVFEFLVPKGFGAAMDLPISNSVFNQLFLRHLADRRYFRPVRLNTPSYQIWEVHGDRIPAPSAEDGG